jgi:tetratricopeptide (TPR) repeat protein
MNYLLLDVEVNAWEAATYELIGRCESTGASARQVARFPLGPLALEARLPGLRRALARTDLGAGRAAGEDERAVGEFSGLLYGFLFSGEIGRLLDDSRAAAVRQWKGLRLRLVITAPALQGVPWETLWDILAFDLHSLRRGVFDLRVERVPREAAAQASARPVTLRPLTSAGLPADETSPEMEQALDLVQQADAAFYSPDFARAAELYMRALRLAPQLRLARENLARALECLNQRIAHTAVPPRAAAGFSRAWDVYSMYRFDEAAHWLHEAHLLAKDWGIAEWPEAAALHKRIERALTGLANYQEGLTRSAGGDLESAMEAVSQAYRADPLEVYRALLEEWGRVFET